MGIGIYSIGVSGLSAAQAGLVTTGHNISNANTPGYSRQEIVQGTNVALQTGSGFFGQGTHVETVKRIYSDFLAGQVRDAQTQSSSLDAYLAQIQQIDNMLSDPVAGLSPALSSFFSGVQTVANQPESIPARQAMLSSAQALAGRFQDMNLRVQQIRDGVNSQIESSITSINAYAQQIAQLNDKIVLAYGSGQPPNDLLDQRDQLIQSMGKEIGVTVLKQDDGSINVFVGNGQPMVVGLTAFSLKAVSSTLVPGNIDVAYVTPGTTQLLSSSILTGGALGGLLAFRSASLDATQNALGRIAIGLASTFNDQHQLGQDLNGALGGIFFNTPVPQVNPSTANTGNAVIGATISNVSALTASDYRMKYDGTNYTVTRVSDGNTWTFAAFPQVIDGVTLNLSSGAAVTGDQFLIQPTVNGARDISVAISDPAKIAAAAPIRTAAAAANTGNAMIGMGSVNTPPPSDPNLQQPVTLTFTSAGTFDVSGTGTGNPAGVVYTSGGSITYNGWTVQITGTPAVGDVFTVGPNTAGISDNRNALALGALQTQKLLAGGTASYQNVYGQLVSDIGNKAHELQITSAAQATVLSQATAAQQSVSGVNLDEEAANLMRYQQAYQAAAKVIQIADTVFNSLLDLGK